MRCYNCKREKTQSPVCEHCGFDERKLVNYKVPEEKSAEDTPGFEKKQGSPWVVVAALALLAVLVIPSMKQRDRAAVEEAPTMATEQESENTPEKTPVFIKEEPAQTQEEPAQTKEEPGTQSHQSEEKSYDPSENILMSDADEEGENVSEQFLNTGLNRDQISSITFLDTLEDAPEGAVDVSEAQNGKVLAWSVPDEDYYDLYIAGEVGVAAPANCSRLFAQMVALRSITFNGAFDTSNVTDMSSMFKYCVSLTELSMERWDTSNVTDMGGMLSYCKALTELDVSGFDTSNVTNMSEMFRDCASLTELDLSGFDTSNVTDMSYMFSSCESLTELDVSGFDTSKVENMRDIFDGCDSLPESVKNSLN